MSPDTGQTPARRSPAHWPWSSYPGYDRRRRRVGWVAYEALHSAWRGESGGNDLPEAAYRRFVEQGLARAPANPFQSAAHGWLLGSETFIERMRSLLSEPRNQDEVPAARQLASLDAAIVLAEVARYYGVDQDCFQVRRSGLLGRDLAAWLVRHHSSATLRELSRSPKSFAHSNRDELMLVIPLFLAICGLWSDPDDPASFVGDDYFRSGLFYRGFFSISPFCGIAHKMSMLTSLGSP